MPKILITGANGFTGRHAIDYFSNKGLDVIAVVRTKTVFQKTLNHSIEKCDLTNERAVNNLIKNIKPDFILHLAGKNSVEESWNSPAYYILTNTMSTLYLLEALRKHCSDSKTLIVGSALQFNPCSKSSPLHPYSVSKGLQALVADSWKDLFKLDITIAKPSNLIGPGLSNGVCSVFAKKISEIEQGKIAPTLNVSDLSAKRDFIDVRDAVRAYDYLLKMKTTADEYEICTGIPRSLGEVIKTFQSLTETMLVIENGQTVSKQFSPIMENDKMRALNWEPLIPFEKSLEDTLQFYRANQ
ncbi:NAD-dependent epimerase/dehydratase family protein [Neobacillus sp. K501]